MVTLMNSIQDALQLYLRVISHFCNRKSSDENFEANRMILARSIPKYKLITRGNHHL